MRRGWWKRGRCAFVLVGNALPYNAPPTPASEEEGERGGVRRRRRRKKRKRKEEGLIKANGSERAGR
jgi:hypothetical protein